MKKKTRHPRQRKAAGKKQATTAVPPLIAALIRFTDPHVEGLTGGFIKAYAAMPKLIDATVDSNEDQRYDLISDLSGLTKIRETIDQRGAESILASTANPSTFTEQGILRAVALLEHDDPDLLAELTTPVTDAAFDIGFAFAAYLLTQGGAR